MRFENTKRHVYPNSGRANVAQSTPKLAYLLDDCVISKNVSYNPTDALKSPPFNPSEALLIY